MQRRKPKHPVAPTQHSKPSHRGRDQQPSLGWDDLKVFRAIAVEGSMRAAGLELSINASTASRRLTSLEEALGAKLFERHPEGLALTAAGREVLCFAERLDGSVTELQRRVRGRDQLLEGVLRVSVAEILGGWACGVLGKLAQQHPSLELELQISDALVGVERHQVDVVLRAADAAPADLVGKKLGRSGVGLYASVGYVERHGSELSTTTQRWVAWPRAVEHKPAFQWLNAQYPERQTAIRVSSANAVLQAVKRSVGIAPLAHSQAFDEPSLLCLQSMPKECSTPVWLLTHRDLQKAAKIRAAFDAFGEASGCLLQANNASSWASRIFPIIASG